MVQTVTARPSHYEVLGVEPTANSDEIARAFAREMGRPRAFGGLADVSIAYEVLRNPERRRAYDESIAVAKKPGPQPELEPFRRPMALHARPQFIASPFPHSPALLKEEPAPEQMPEEPKVEVAPVEKPNQPSLPPFFANALREIADPAPLPKAVPTPTPTRRREAKLEEAPTPIPRMVIEPMFADDGAAPWKRLAIPAGAVVLAAALIGAYAGWQSKDPTTAAPKAQAALLTPPPMTTYSVNDPVEKVAETQVPNQSPTLTPAASAPRPERRNVRRMAARQSSRLADVEQQLAPPAVVDAAQTEAPQQATELQPARALAASMPLPNSVIARTIGRIGYPCGSVASTSGAGSPGVFTVTCTSGHSYKAAPVRGRYHFSRVRG